MTTKGSRLLSTRAEDPLHDRVEALADRLGISKSETIRQLVVAALDAIEGAPSYPSEASPKRPELISPRDPQAGDNSPAPRRAAEISPIAAAKIAPSRRSPSSYRLPDRPGLAGRR